MHEVYLEEDCVEKVWCNYFIIINSKFYKQVKYRFFKIRCLREQIMDKGVSTESVKPFSVAIEQ